MNKAIKSNPMSFESAHDKEEDTPQKSIGLLTTLLSVALLGTAPSVMAIDECGPGPTVSCTQGNYTSGITYDFSSDLSVTTNGTVGIGGAAAGLRLTGSGNANASLTTNGVVWGVGGIRVNLGSGSLEADIRNNVADTSSITNRNPGTGLHVSTGGAANLRLHGNRAPGVTPYRLSNLVMDTGSDSRVWVDYRRAVVTMTLSPRAGSTLTIDNDGGILGNEFVDRVSAATVISGAGAGHLVLNNALPRSRINGNMDFTGMTGQLTILNDYSGNSRQGGWHTIGTSVFGSGDVDIRNGLFGVLRTAGDAVLDFSDTRSAQFVNRGRVMVGAVDGFSTDWLSDNGLTFIGLDRFENAGLILLGTDFATTTDQGDITSRYLKERLVFEDSNYVGAGGVIAFDTLLGRTAQADCATLSASDCVRFTGDSVTEGRTLVRVRDFDAERSVAGFNPGIVMIEGASAAEHFVLDPTSQFYAGHTSGGAALQKGMITYRFEYDAGTRQHALVGTLADEAVQAATLGAAAHEIWRASADTWFDRQATVREEREAGFVPQGLWATLNVSRGDRDLQRTMEIAGRPTAFNLAQDQDVTHFAFGLDLLQGRSGAQSWSGGVTLGMLYSTVDYEATRKQTNMAGMSGGLYGSWALGALTVDGMFNVNYLRQSVDGSNFGLGEHNRLRTQVKSNGGRVEAAWTLPVNDSFWLQPLLGVSHVRTSEGDLLLPGGAGGVRFGNDDRSWRVGAGLRAGMDSRIAGLRAQYRLTGRYWDEQEAENTVEVDVPNEAAPIKLVDAFDGNFSELDGSIAVSNDAGSLSGYIGVKGKFGDDYSSVGGSAGVRYHW
jgi:hypothetical protein